MVTMCWKEAPVADQPLADGAIIQMLRRIPDCHLPGIPEFLLIQRIKDDLFSLCRGSDSCLGKAHLLASVLPSAGSTSNPEEEYLTGGQIRKQHFDQILQSQLTAFRDLDRFILLVK